MHETKRDPAPAAGRPRAPELADALTFLQTAAHLLAGLSMAIGSLDEEEAQALSAIVAPAREAVGNAAWLVEAVQGRANGCAAMPHAQATQTSSFAE
ncbi:hypothetical protein [Salinarimonas ramus]|uniref:Uncharacterized protein n=1 Tax=Salinarimonas ramus TaxID=690164 RepID=A0A917Q3R6_9HYPH|nr:hypothetical protein [Salinarimonas ramus]GGK18293.1 hypothetical protein GCM10011322_01290 [Salinarimonas ramus]